MKFGTGSKVKFKTVPVLALALVVLFAVISGGSSLRLGEIAYALIHPQADSQANIIIWQLRLPRIALGLLVGAGLSCCGVVLQAMLRNPLAEPYTLGVSSAAALGATLAIVLNLKGPFVMVSSFLGSLAAIFFLYTIASKKRFDNNTLILGGVTLGLLFSSLVFLILSLAKQENVHASVIWLMGNLASAKPEYIKPAVFFIVAGILILIALGRDIDAICLGDEKARHLGLDIILTKRILFFITSLIAAACVSICGVIGFVGLIIPHISRFAFGLNHRRLMINASILGAAFLVFCDAMARTIIAPLEVPVGVITGIFGGIFFLGLLVKSKKWNSI
jgi:iron complex transport system permease protein